MINSIHWRSFFVNPDITVQVNQNTPTLSASLEQTVEKIWQDSKHQFPQLFNGRVFTVDTITPHHITGHWTEYRRILAQIKKPELYKSLSLRSLAINGLITCPEGFIIGKRASNSVYLPDYWQSPPAGSIESRHGNHDVNLPEQLYAEALEELGLSDADLEWDGIVSATEHPDSHIIDLGVLLKTKLPFSEVLKRWENNANQEYSQLNCWPITSEIPKDFLPTTKIMIEAWRQKNGI